MTEHALRTAIATEIKAIHTLSKLGDPSCPDWIAGMVQDHCRAVKVLSTLLFDEYHVSLHHHPSGPLPCQAAEMSADSAGTRRQDRRSSQQVAGGG